jgi:hypothetical protein
MNLAAERRLATALREGRVRRGLGGECEAFEASGEWCWGGWQSGSFAPAVQNERESDWRGARRWQRIECWNG